MAPADRCCSLHSEGVRVGLGLGDFSASLRASFFRARRAVLSMVNSSFCLLVLSSSSCMEASDSFSFSSSL